MTLTKNSQQSQAVQRFYVPLALLYVVLPLPFDILLKQDVIAFPVTALIRGAIIALFILRANLEVKAILAALILVTEVALVLLLKNTGGSYGLPYLVVKIVAIVCLGTLFSNVLHRQLAVKIIKYFLVVYSLNVLLVLSGVIFNIDTFALADSDRFGYTGLLPSAGNEAAILLIILFTAIFVNNTKRKFLDLTRFNSRLVFFCIFLSCSLSGSKIATLYPFLMIMLWYFRFKTLWLFITIACSAILSAYWFAQELSEVFAYLVRYYNEKGLVSMLFADRISNILEVDLEISAHNLMIGAATQVTNLEMDILTTYFNLGFLSLLIIVTMFYRIAIFWPRDRISLFYVSTIIFCSFFVGHVFESGFLIVPLVALTFILRSIDAKPRT